MKTPSSQLIKDVAALKQRKFREESGTILVEGRHPIEEALKAGLTMRQLFFLPNHPGGYPNRAFPVEPFEVDEKSMARMASTDSPPPCLAVFERPEPLKKLQGSLVLLLDGLQDPGNLGTLIRSAIAFGVDTVVLTDDSVEPYNPKVIRASAGLVFAVPVLVRKRSAMTALFDAPDWKLYATTGQPGATSYRQVDYAGRCVVILGNEGRGISDALFPDRDLLPLTIPMTDAVESLNVAISGSIILAEAAACRKAYAATGVEG